jgi:type IV pilus assembly protein PilO
VKLADFRNLDTGNVGAWPQGVKYTFAVLLVILILAGGWYFKFKSQQEQFRRVELEERDLRQQFERDQGRVVNLEAYREQLAEMDAMFQQMVKQLPSKTEMPELLVDISQSALAAGIDTQLFEPGAETPKDFYAEKPISVRMVGDYHQFGDFISRIAALSRVVVLEMTHVAPETAPTAGARRSPRRPAVQQSAAVGGPLKLEGVIRTYRYLDEDEQAQLAAAEDAAAKTQNNARRR